MAGTYATLTRSETRQPNTNDHEDRGDGKIPVDNEFIITTANPLVLAVKGTPKRVTDGYHVKRCRLGWFLTGYEANINVLFMLKIMLKLRQLGWLEKGRGTAAGKGKD